MKFKITVEQSQSIRPIWLVIIENIKTKLKVEIPFGQDHEAQERANGMRARLELVLNG